MNKDILTFLLLKYSPTKLSINTIYRIASKDARWDTKKDILHRKHCTVVRGEMSSWDCYLLIFSHPCVRIQTSVIQRSKFSFYWLKSLFLKCRRAVWQVSPHKNEINLYFKYIIHTTINVQRFFTWQLFHQCPSAVETRERQKTLLKNLVMLKVAVMRKRDVNKPLLLSVCSSDCEESSCQWVERTSSVYLIKNMFRQLEELTRTFLWKLRFTNFSIANVLLYFIRPFVPANIKHARLLDPVRSSLYLLYFCFTGIWV